MGAGRSDGGERGCGRVGAKETEGNRRAVVLGGVCVCVGGGGGTPLMPTSTSPTTCPAPPHRSLFHTNTRTHARTHARMPPASHDTEFTRSLRGVYAEFTQSLQGALHGVYKVFHTEIARSLHEVYTGCAEGCKLPTMPTAGRVYSGARISPRRGRVRPSAEAHAEYS
jgi:hypothetical protein